MTKSSDFWPPANPVREARLPPPQARGGLGARLERSLGRQLAYLWGWGRWDLEPRARLARQWVAFLVRYSNGGCTWGEAESLGMCELASRVHNLTYWIKVENKPPGK